jgi:hypothetical protein
MISQVRKVQIAYFNRSHIYGNRAVHSFDSGSGKKPAKWVSAQLYHE